MLVILFVMWVLANFLVPMIYVDQSNLERRFQNKSLKRLDYLLMIIFFPMTILVATLYIMATYGGRLIGKIAKKDITKKFWRWLNESPSKEKKKHD